MGRYYRLSKKLTEDESREVQREMREIADVEDVSIKADERMLFVRHKGRTVFGCDEPGSQYLQPRGKRSGTFIRTFCGGIDSEESVPTDNTRTF